MHVGSMDSRDTATRAVWYQRVLDVAECSDTRFTAVALAEGSHVRALLVCFEPGQHIPVHAPAVDLAVVVLEGSGTLECGGEVVALAAGSMAFVPAGESRGIRATDRMVTFQVVGPLPTLADHVAVEAGLANEER